MWTIRYYMVCIVMLCAMSENSAASFKAVRDFSAMNPNGSWSYGYGPSIRRFTPYTVFTENCYKGILVGIDCWEAYPSAPNAQVGVNATGVPFSLLSIVVPTDVLVMHPSAINERSIVRWTCPEPGTYEIFGFFEILDRFPTGVVARIFVNSNNVDAIAFAAGNGELTGPGANLKTVTPGQRKPFSFSRFLAKDTVISFGISAKRNYGNDTTGFSATIRKISP